MARKYEFKPDKPRSNWISKLHMTQLQRASLLKWTLYCVLLLVLSVLQDVVLCQFRINGATTELVPCAIFLITIMEGSEKGSVFALISAALYVFTGTPAGPYCLVYITALAIFVCIFRQGYLQKGFAAAMLCVVFAMLVYEMAVFATGLFLGLTRLDRVTAFLTTAGLSLIAAPVLYPIILFIGSLGGDSWKE